MRNFNVRWYQSILIIFCFFVYFFPFKVYGFDPRLLVLFIYFVFAYKDKFSLRLIDAKYVKCLVFPLFMLIFTLFSGVINNMSMEGTFIIFIFQIIYLIFLSYCVYYITKRCCKSIDFYIITRYFLLVLVIQSIVAIAMFVSQPICSFLFELQGIDPNSRVLEMFLGVRLIGLGCFYFGAGVIYGLGLISIMPLLLTTSSSKQRVKLMMLYAYLFVVGIFFARTTLVGAAISFIYLFSSISVPRIRRTMIAVTRQFFVFLLVISGVLVVLYNSSPRIQEKYGAIVSFGFEAFINLYENGEFSTKSSDGLKEYHLSIWPKNVKTYYVGDTRWTNGDSYYGDSDVGYIRLLYYFGIPGVILFILYEFSAIKAISSAYGIYVFKDFFMALFLYSLILLIKGYVDVAALLFIYLHYKYSDTKYENCIFY